MRANFEFTCDPPAVLVRIAGDLDLDTCNELEDLLESVESIGCTQVELDVAALTFIDLPVLAVLCHEQRRLRVSGGDLRVVAASRSFEDACERAEADTMLPQSATSARLTALPD